MNSSYKHELAYHLASFLEEEVSQIFSLISVVPKDQEGDFSLPCFFLAKKLKKTPIAIAIQIFEEITLPENFSSIVAIKGYLNFTLDQKSFALKVLGSILKEQEDYGKGLEGEQKKITLDFSSPNIGKELAFHHLRGTMLGNALSYLFKASGYKTNKINHLGDWGTSYGKLIIAYLNKIEEDFSFKQKKITIEELNLLYTQFSRNVEKDPSLEDKAKQAFKELEKGNVEYQKLWKIFKEITLKELEKIYSILGVNFDSYKGESFFAKQIEDLIKVLKNKNLVIESQGALIVDLKNFDTVPLLLKKSDGSSLYSVRDICAAIYRQEKYDFDLNLYVVDNGQALHFKQVFKVLELMGFDWFENCQHIPFGLILNQNVNGKWEKGKTRTGQFSLLKDVIEQATQKILGIINQKNPTLKNKQEVAQNIAVIALTFNDLKHKRQHNVKFNWEQALSFDGDSGPYVVNAFVRLKSILRKYDQDFGKENSQSDKVWFDQFENIKSLEPYQEEPAQDLIVLLAMLSEKRQKACETREPCVLAQYTLVLADAIHYFIHHCRILGSKQQQERIVLVYCAQQVLKNALNWIGLKPVEYM